MKATINGTEVFGTPSEMKELLGLGKARSPAKIKEIRTPEISSEKPKKNKRRGKKLKIWTPEEDAIVRKDLKKGVTIRASAEKLGRTMSAVGQRRVKLKKR